jgi:RNA polymerase sigma factor (sigma-70 family)
MELAHTLLTHAQEQSLIRLIQSGDRSAEEELIRCNERLIYKIALRYIRNAAPDVELDDLMQEGRSGLLRAAYKWDDAIAQKKGVTKFSTYASWWVFQCIRRYASRHRSGFSRSIELDDMAFSVYRVQSDLMESLKHEPSNSEIALSGKIPLTKINSILSTPVIVHLDADTRSEQTEHENIADTSQDLQQTVESSVMASACLHCLESDHPRHARVVRMIYGLNDNQRAYSMAEIARMMGITRERVRQIHDEALKFIRLTF